MGENHPCGGSNEPDNRKVGRNKRLPTQIKELLTHVRLHFHAFGADGARLSAVQEEHKYPEDLSFDVRPADLSLSYVSRIFSIRQSNHSLS